jgi:hypothetical protein
MSCVILSLSQLLVSVPNLVVSMVTALMGPVTASLGFMVVTAAEVSIYYPPTITVDASFFLLITTFFLHLL